jgi:hypothetical protein
MHIIDMTFDDVPVRITFNKAGLVRVRVQGTTGVLLYRAYMKDVMEWVSVKVADVKRVGTHRCPDCGDALNDCGDCVYCSGL